MKLNKSMCIWTFCPEGQSHSCHVGSNYINFSGAVEGRGLQEEQSKINVLETSHNRADTVPLYFAWKWFNSPYLRLYDRVVWCSYCPPVIRAHKRWLHKYIYPLLCLNIYPHTCPGSSHYHSFPNVCISLGTELVWRRLKLQQRFTCST